MWYRQPIWRLAIVGLVAIALLTACDVGGVPQGEYNLVKQQLAEQQQKAAALQKQLSDATAKEKEAAGAKPILAAQQVPPPPPRPTNTPLPPGVTPPPAPAPPAAKSVPIYAYIDTVTAGPSESKFNVDANLSCVKTSLFSRGMHIVWRMELVDTATGKVLQGADVKDATLKLPNGEEVKFRYGRHGATEDSPWFWTAAWDVPMNHPLGVVDYAVVVTTQDGKSASIKEPLIVSLPARQMDTRLTIVP